jgi:hypothetical protein
LSSQEAEVTTFSRWSSIAGWGSNTAFPRSYNISWRFLLKYEERKSILNQTFA